MKPIKSHKSICRAIAPQGYEYAGHDGNHYLFAKRSFYGSVYKIMRCVESDLTADKLAKMAGVLR